MDMKLWDWRLAHLVAFGCPTLDFLTMPNGVFCTLATWTFYDCVLKYTNVIIITPCFRGNLLDEKDKSPLIFAKFEWGRWLLLSSSMWEWRLSWRFLILFLIATAYPIDKVFPPLIDPYLELSLDHKLGWWSWRRMKIILVVVLPLLSWESSL